MAYDEALAGRVRTSLSGTGAVEKKMFGGLVFMTSGHLTVGIYGDGLIARVGAEGMAEAVTEPGVRPFQMGARAMRGIVLVPARVAGPPGARTARSACRSPEPRSSSSPRVTQTYDPCPSPRRTRSTYCMVALLMQPWRHGWGNMQYGPLRMVPE